MRWLCALVLATGPALSGDGVATSGLLSDHDFHRLVACGAAPGGPCRTALAAWPDRKVTIALHKGSGPPPGLMSGDLSATLDAAVAQVNGAGAAIRLLRRADNAPADIVVRPSAFREGEPLTAEPGVPDGTVIGLAQVQVWWNDDRHLTAATILIAADMNRADLPSIMLEEVVQALGMTWDIENPLYEDVSIFAQGSNSVTVLAGQDLAAIHLHYPTE